MAHHTPIAQIPPFLNDYRVVATLPSQRAGDDAMIVVVHRPGHPAHEYVVAAWLPRFGDTWDSGDYHATLAGALAALVERSRVPLPERKKHDEGSAPPPHFKRYQIEIDAPDEIDPSELLERAQTLAVDLMDAAEDDDQGWPQATIDLVVDRTSIQAMEG